MRPTRTVALLTVAGLVLSSGLLCWRSGDGPAPRSAVRLDDYALATGTQSGRYWDDESLLGEAEERLVVACMRDRGHPLIGAGPPPFTAAPRPGDPTAVDMPYRRLHGYGIVDSVAADTRGEGAPPFPPGYGDALTGRRSLAFETRGGDVISVASGGCRGAARATLAGSVRRWAVANYAPGYLNDDLMAAVARDPGWSRLRDGWRRCMADAGYAFADYGAPRQLVEREVDAHGATRGSADRERRLAVADGVCLIRSRVIETRLELCRAAALRMSAAWRSELAEVAKVRRAAATTSRATLAG